MVYRHKPYGGTLEVRYREDPTSWSVTAGSILEILSRPRDDGTLKWPPSAILEALRARKRDYDGVEDYEIWDMSRQILTGAAEVLSLLTALSNTDTPDHPVDRDPSGGLYWLNSTGKADAAQCKDDWVDYVAERRKEK